MTKVSKRILDKTVEQRIFEIFWETFSKINDSKEAEIFLKDLLSPIEQIMLAKRLAIAILLYKGYTYDQIIDLIKVSRNTIMNVSIQLKHRGQGYKKSVEKIINQEKTEELFDKIDNILLKLSLPAAIDSPRYGIKKEKGKRLFHRHLKRNIL